MDRPRGKRHITESKSRQLFAAAMTGFCNEEYDEGDLLFRELSERDYGIDGEVEVFQHGEPTGRIAKIQLKSTEKKIEKLKTIDVVSCSGISKSNLSYCRQKKYPVMLVYCSVADGKFYYIDLQSVYKNKIPEIGDKELGTVRIPISNNSDDLSFFVDIINSYYEEEQAGIAGKRQESIQQFVGHEDRISTYVFLSSQNPSDGEHREINRNGDIVAEGLYKNGKLISGVEFDYLIHVTEGELIHKPNCPKDPYDASEDFEYERMEPYGWEELSPFDWSTPYIEHEGLESFYIVDLEVTEETEQMTNIRTLEEFLEKKNPKLLEGLKKRLRKRKERIF